MSATVARPAARRVALGYLELTKPRIVSLVVVTGLPALLMAAPGLPAPGVFWGALAGTLGNACQACLVVGGLALGLVLGAQAVLTLSVPPSEPRESPARSRP